MIKVAISGGFDPLHVGHIKYIQNAIALGDHLIVILNGDSFLMRKKGFIFMPAEERVEIIRAIRGVDEVCLFNSEKDDVCDALAMFKPNIFAKGGDRTGPENIPEWDFCQKNHIDVVVGVGGGKIQSSQWLTKSIELKEKNK